MFNDLLWDTDTEAAAENRLDVEDAFESWLDAANDAE